MNQPTPEFQLDFLNGIQRILSDGQFVATYKFALLLALAELSVELGSDSGAELEISTRDIADKFVHLYWRQVIPYSCGNQTGPTAVLAQNTGRQAAVINQLIQARKATGSSLAALKQNSVQWRNLIGKVDEIVRRMPLWKLQTVGEVVSDFLYPNAGKGNYIVLKPGIAFCFRKFYALVGNMVQGAWLKFVRKHNMPLLGDHADLSDFLFGLQRRSLKDVKDILLPLQNGECFYCGRSMRRNPHVDHFIPWSCYPVDLGHNFVLAHAECNASKSDHIAAPSHLETWLNRNRDHGMGLANAFDQKLVIHNLDSSLSIARWAYEVASSSGRLAWLEGKEMVPLEQKWKEGLKLDSSKDL